MAKYCRERQVSPRRFDPRSFRTIARGGRGVKQIVGCTKNEYNRRSKKCQVGMRVQTILYPEGSDPRCKRGEAGKELKRAKRHKNPHLSGRYDFVGLLSKGIVKKIKHLLKIHGIKVKITKNVSGHGDPNAQELYVGKGYGREALALVGATFRSTEV